jgi:Zn-dependent M28 family amino/carboxypeptidase
VKESTEALPQPDRARLERDVRRMAVPRHPDNSRAALDDVESFVATELLSAGLAVTRQPFTWKGSTFNNVVGRREGGDPSRPWVVVGAHFDSTPHTPGADDNASAVAAMLEIARLLEPWRPAATVEYVGFNLEEIQTVIPPMYRVGSLHYARQLKADNRKVAGALVLEMVGYTGAKQTVPAAVNLVKKVPKTGDFLAAVGDGKSGALLEVMERAAAGVMPLVTLSVPLRGWLVPDTRRSDNARFWDEGYPSLMITDTADLRNPHYHRATDTPDTLNYEFMANVVTTVTRAIRILAG